VSAHSHSQPKALAAHTASPTWQVGTAPRQLGAPGRTLVLSSALAGLCLALAVFGGRIEIGGGAALSPGRAAPAALTTKAAGSANSQLRHRQSRTAASTLRACGAQTQTSHSTRVSFTAACGPARGA